MDLTLSQPTTTPTWHKNLFQSNRILLSTTVIYTFLFVATLVLSTLDSRLVTGMPVWIKPMKFAISSILYTVTLAWILSYVEGRRWLVTLVSAVTAVSLLVEIVIITAQAVRGVQSHFNFSTPLDGILFNIMGGFILLLWIMNIVAAGLMLTQRMTNRPFAWGLRLGLLITMFGSGLGFFMTTPTPDQLEQIGNGEVPAIIGAHSVGVPDGGEGLPFTGWSTEGGDIRVAHFVGLHALQIVPLAGIVINRIGESRWREGQRLGLVFTVGLGYLGLVALLLWQALRGQPLITPNAATLSALGLLVLLVSSASLAIINRK